MAVNREPILKRCKSLGISPAVMGIAKETKRDPNANKRKKVSEYGMQLKEKQKLKFIYGVLEKSNEVSTGLTLHFLSKLEQVTELLLKNAIDELELLLFLKLHTLF